MSIYFTASQNVTMTIYPPKPDHLGFPTPSQVINYFNSGMRQRVANLTGLLSNSIIILVPPQSCYLQFEITDGRITENLPIGQSRINNRIVQIACLYLLNQQIIKYVVINNQQQLKL
ncbi:Hypothetical_protein [Hexamita inflata]|uniref:Hypothetical_protein n=1 Tax=Hexamita inflata TaxID=28002 RepID=A0ABP1GL38_9EUKA